MTNNFLPVILGTDANAYGMARSFFEKYKVKSLVIGKFALTETKYSNILDVKIYDNLTDNNVFIDTMNKIKDEFKDKKLILISCAEWYTDLIVNNKDFLEKYFILPFMDKQLKEKLENKEDFYKLCEKYKLDYPKTFIIDKSKDISNFKYPVVLKPSSSTSYSKINFEGKEKCYKINDEQTLIKLINKIYDSKYEGNLIVQDFIPGKDDSMWVLNCYSNKKGKVKMMCLGHCILEEHTPYGVGNYKAIISDGNDKIYKQIKDFLEDIGYVGYSNFDFKYDYRDNKYKLFEINIRQGRSSFFTTSCGCNLVKFLIDDYIFNKDEEIYYNYKKHLWLGTPKSLLKKYVNKNVLNEAKELIKNGEYTYTLKYEKDYNLLRMFWMNRIYLKDYKLFKLYPPKDGEI